MIRLLQIGLFGALVVFGSDANIAAHAADAQPGEPSSESVWNALADSKMKSDAKTGGYWVEHSAAARQLAGKQLKVSGIIFSLESKEQPVSFALLHHSTGCLSCDLGDPTQAIFVRSNELASIQGTAVTIAGRLSIQDGNDQGLFYQLDDAQLVRD